VPQRFLAAKARGVAAKALWHASHRGLSTAAPVRILPVPLVRLGAAASPEGAPAASCNLPLSLPVGNLSPPRPDTSHGDCPWGCAALPLGNLSPPRPNQQGGRGGLSRARRAANSHGGGAFPGCAALVWRSRGSVPCCQKKGESLLNLIMTSCIGISGLGRRVQDVWAGRLGVHTRFAHAFSHTPSLRESAHTTHPFNNEGVEVQYPGLDAPEPSMDALSLRSDVISSINILSLTPLRAARRSTRSSPLSPPWRQPRGKSMVSLVNYHTNATRIGWHLWEI